MKDLWSSDDDTKVRWQAYMEAHLREVRALTDKSEKERSQAFAQAATAHATAAVALAIANGLSDLEGVLADISESLVRRD